MPAPSGMHAKLLREARELSPFIVVPSSSGLPGHIRVADWLNNNPRAWSGHRDLMPREYRFAQDPYNLLRRPDSSD